MNICLKCQSAYEKPGTCNCYAEVELAKPFLYPPYYTAPPGWPNPIPHLPGAGTGDVVPDPYHTTCEITYDPTVPTSYTVN